MSNPLSAIAILASTSITAFSQTVKIVKVLVSFLSLLKITGAIKSLVALHAFIYSPDTLTSFVNLAATIHRELCPVYR